MNDSKISPEAEILIKSLRIRKINSEPGNLNKDDGYSDVIIPESRIKIEIDDLQNNAVEELEKMKRDYYSFAEGYFTLRIPSSLLVNNLEEVSDTIAEMIEEINQEQESEEEDLGEESV
jgi:very-short-patch-repair endonuclease